MNSIIEMYVKTAEDQKRYTEFFQKFNVKIPIAIEIDPVPLPIIVTPDRTYQGQVAVGLFLKTITFHAGVDAMFALSPEELGQAALAYHQGQTE